MEIATDVKIEYKITCNKTELDMMLHGLDSIVISEQGEYAKSAKLLWDILLAEKKQNIVMEN